ncbi:alanine dehydrogenase [Carboxylicivirga sp. N1Y90]|uniref:alanine dehydrogenase n=1 Tax=Carboxylicivirga fragile TaxID=3417571 RepID=UPI003D328856|nr:alanine dehydrogenase [Marinilabiliaceae bacterium N1Y90]
MGEKSPYFPMSQTHLLPREEMLETGRRKKKVTIGIPKDSSTFENRVPLTPQGVELLTENGHTIYLESGAGDRSHFFDHDFSECGAIISKKTEVFKADIILKVSALTSEEIDFLQPNQVVISLLHMYNQSRETIQHLMDKRVNAIGFEILKDAFDCFPVVRSMSEIEGAASVMIASEYLSKAFNGKGVLLGGVTGISPSELVILGAGTAGEFAARAALGLGATVKVFDNSYHKLRELERNLGQRIFTSVLHPQSLTKALQSADAVIGSLRYLQRGHTFMVSEEQVSQMKKGSIIIDLSMDQGGCIETSKCTNYDRPTFNKHGVIHYCVPNIASRVSKTASIALSNIFTPILLRLGEVGGIQNLIKEEVGVSHGIYIYKGILTNDLIGNRFNIPSKDIGLLMAAF